MSKPNFVALVGVCPFCHESVELPLSKKQVKKLVKGFKGSALKNVAGVKAECSHCKKPIEILATKRELKAIYAGFREESTVKAELKAEKLREKRGGI